MAEPLSWSYSKSALFRDCPKAFSFEEQGVYPVTGHSPSVSLASIVGVSVHHSIKQEIDHWSRGERLELARAEAAAEAFIREVWADAPSRICEARNGASLASVSPERFIRLSRSRVRDFVRLIWPRFRNHTYLLHEEDRMFTIGDVVVWTRVDLCTRDADGQIVITDWKTGRIGPEEVEGMQLGVYVDWARNEFHVPTGQVRGQIVSLRTLEFLPRFVSDAELTRLRGRITRQVQDWGKRFETHNFPAAPSPTKCVSCRFFQWCDEGRAAVDARSLSGLAEMLD